MTNEFGDCRVEVTVKTFSADGKCVAESTWKMKNFKSTETREVEAWPGLDGEVAELVPVLTSRTYSLSGVVVGD